MTRQNATIEALKSKGYQAINDFSLEQCVRSIQRGDSFEVNNNGAYIRVRFFASDGWTSGDMMRRVTDEEFSNYMQERKETAYQVKRKARPDWKQDD